MAGDDAASTPASRVEQAYQTAKARYAAQPTNNTIAWQFASACFDKGDFAQNNTDRARVANEGIAACRHALGGDPNLAQAHYYLGMNLGQLARTKLLGALSLLGDMEKEWLTTEKLDENFDYVGADRNLGSLYFNAPDWPISIGSRANARTHLLRAVKLHPEYPENHLNLLEAYIKWNDHAGSTQESNALVQMLPEAKKQFTGPDWESNWDDWNNRWATMQKELSKEADASGSHGRK